jgi:hypothetical protein
MYLKRIGVKFYPYIKNESDILTEEDFNYLLQGTGLLVRYQ